MERDACVTFMGNPITLIGPELQLGQDAPNVTLLDNEFKPFELSSLIGHPVIVCSVPSLDTPVCDLETRTFNEKAASLGPQVKIITVSMDLPPAQARWCGAAGIDRVMTLSDHRDAAFGLAWGVLIKELRLLTRAVFVVDAQGNIRYIQIVPEITNSPDYQAALDAVDRL